MAITAVHPSPPPSVAAVFSVCPDTAASHLNALRAMVYETANKTPGAGQITEILKWGQPAYLTEKPRSGTTIRFGWDEGGTRISLFVHCQTSLVDEWRQRYGDQLNFIGTREVSIPTDKPLPKAPLQHCIAMALTYHQRKTSK